MTHKTRAIILHTVNYGNTSLVVTAYTELFGLQSYMVKGLRSAGKPSSKLAFFQPGAFLQLEVYHNTLKQLQFIKETDWDHINQATRSDVVRNLCAAWCLRQIIQCIKEPETNTELFEFLHYSLLSINEQPLRIVANIPGWFTLQICKYLGLQLQGSFTPATPVLDLQEGSFVSAGSKEGIWLVQEKEAELISAWSRLSDCYLLGSYSLNRQMRNQLLSHLQQYFLLHVPGYKADNLLNLLQDILD